VSSKLYHYLFFVGIEAGGFFLMDRFTSFLLSFYIQWSDSLSGAPFLILILPYILSDFSLGLLSPGSWSLLS
jgi:hypothetical protein